MEVLDELEWRSPEWINVYGLRTDNILEYFSLSPFWDRQCNNQILKMQRQFQFNGDGAAVAVTIPTFDAELRKLRGVEYVVHMIKEPDLWVIRKQRRLNDGSVAYGRAKDAGAAGVDKTMALDRFLGGGPGLGVCDDVDVLADYFCIGSKVYMASNMAAILRQGVLSVEQSLYAGVDRLARLSFPAARVDRPRVDRPPRGADRLFLLAARERERDRGAPAQSERDTVPLARGGEQL